MREPHFERRNEATKETKKMCRDNLSLGVRCLEWTSIWSSRDLEFSRKSYQLCPSPSVPHFPFFSFLWKQEE